MRKLHRQPRTRRPIERIADDVWQHNLAIRRHDSRLADLLVHNRIPIGQGSDDCRYLADRQ